MQKIFHVLASCEAYWIIADIGMKAIYLKSFTDKKKAEHICGKLNDIMSDCEEK